MSVAHLPFDSSHPANWPSLGDRGLPLIAMIFRSARIARTAPSPGSGTELIIGEVVCNCIRSNTVKLRVRYVFITFLQCLLNRKDIPLAARDHAIAHTDILLEGMIYPVAVRTT